MVELPAIFLGGLLGSAHCVGMCGPIALTIGGVPVSGAGVTVAAAPRLRVTLARQLLYSTGRIATYVFLGATAGYAGLRLSAIGASLINVQRLFATLAGVAMVLVGLSILRLLPRRRRGGANGCGLAGSMFGGLMQAGGGWGPMVAGLATGFLPCGLVYAFLAKAVAEGSVASGAATMFAFGLGTVPAMVLVGCGGGVISHAARARVLQVAAGLVVLLGGLTVYRGWSVTPDASCHTTGHVSSADSGLRCTSCVHFLLPVQPRKEAALPEHP